MIVYKGTDNGVNFAPLYKTIIISNLFEFNFKNKN